MIGAPGLRAFPGGRRVSLVAAPEIVWGWPRAEAQLLVEAFREGSLAPGSMYGRIKFLQQGVGALAGFVGGDYRGSWGRRGGHFFVNFVIVDEDLFEAWVETARSSVAMGVLA